MAKLKDFNWALLTRSAITKMVLLCKDRIADKPLQVDELHKILSHHLKTYLPINIKRHYRKKTANGYLYVGGLYYSDVDQRSGKPINLVLQYNPSDTHLTITSKRFAKMATLIADTILHEIIHMRQYRRRAFKVLPAYASTANNSVQRANQNYLGNTDEIDAYGFNIACELNQRFKGNDDKVVEYLNTHQTIKQKKHNNWLKYLAAFDNNHNHPKIKQLKKKVIYYLPNAKLGKPYKSEDWLSN